jgi:small conductance mechanosensitive channel
MPQELVDTLIAFLRDVVLPIALIALGAFLVDRVAQPVLQRLIHGLMTAGAGELAADPAASIELQKRIATVDRLVRSLLRILIFSLAIVLILGVLNLQAVLGVIAVAAVVISFAGQDYVRDYLAGFFILFENQFYVGDVVQVGGASGVQGTVEELTLRHTTLRDIGGAVHTVSNGEIRIATNLTRLYSQVNLELELPYATDLPSLIARVDRIGTELAADPEWGDHLLEPPRVNAVNAIGEIGPTIRVQGRVRAGQQWQVRSELRRRIVEAFAAEGVDLFPPRQMTIAGEGATGRAGAEGRRVE